MNNNLLIQLNKLFRLLNLWIFITKDKSLQPDILRLEFYNDYSFHIGTRNHQSTKINTRECPLSSSKCHAPHVLILSLVWHNRKSSCQKLLKKITSRSDTMEQGKPCRQTNSLQKRVATLLAVKGWDKGRKCAYLLSQSITTKIVSNLCEGGSPTMKSNEISSHIRSAALLGIRFRICFVGNKTSLNKSSNIFT